MSSGFSGVGSAGFSLVPRARPAIVGGALVGALVASLGSGAGCGPAVNCENLCTRTLLCEVSFAPSDDLEGARIRSGERTDAESCRLGCEENPAVTAESARCVDEITDETTDPLQCQQPVLACFGAEVSR